MKSPNPAENEFVFYSSRVEKLLGPSNRWEYTVTFLVDNPNINISEMMTCNKEKLQDLKDENDQCLIEIARLQKRVEELQHQEEVLKTHNDNQAKMLMGPKYFHPCKLYPQHSSSRKVNDRTGLEDLHT